MKISKQVVVAGFCAISLQLPVFAQRIVFESPAAWQTQRSEDVVAKVQLDTASMKGKKALLTLSKVDNGKKTKIAEKNIAVKAGSQDVNFGSVKSQLVGGIGYLCLDWQVVKTDEKGSLLPFGVVNLSKIDPVRVKSDVTIQKSAVALDAVAAAKVDAAKFTKIGDISVAYFWTAKELQIVVKKGTASKGKLVFAFDGKNGKNAFVSYPDRFLSYSLQDNGIAADLYNRSMKLDTLVYSQTQWISEIATQSLSDGILVTIPWSDIGFLPFDGRTFGCAAIVMDEKGAQIASWPAAAQYYIPGTWGNIVLK